jgi:hypothetical protein
MFLRPALLLLGAAALTACDTPSDPFVVLQPGESIQATDAPAYVEVASGRLEVQDTHGEWSVLESGALDVYQAHALQRTVLFVDGAVERTGASQQGRFSGTIDIVIDGNI